MVAAATVIASGSTGNSHGTGSWSTASFNPAAGSVLAIFLGMETPSGSADLTASVTITDNLGTPLVYGAKKVSNNTNAGSAGSVGAAWTAPVISGGAMVITWDAGADTLYIANWVIYECTGVDTVTPVGATASGVQGNGSNESVDGALSITLSGAPASTSLTLAFIHVNSTASIVADASPGTGFAQDVVVHSATVEDYATGQQRGGSTSTAVAWADTQADATPITFWAVALAMELKEGAAGFGFTATPATPTLAGVDAVLSTPATAPLVIQTVGAAITASRSPSVTFAGPVLAGDLVILWASSTTTAQTMTEPSGWTNPLGAGVDVESDAHQEVCAWHLVTVAEDVADTVTFTATNWYGATTTGYVHGVLVRFVDAATPIAKAGSTFDSTNTVTPHVLANVADPDATGGLVLSSVAKDGTGAYATAVSGWSFLLASNTNQGRCTLRKHALSVDGTPTGATNITPSAGDEYASITVVVKFAAVGFTVTPATITATGVDAALSLTGAVPQSFTVDPASMGLAGVAVSFGGTGTGATITVAPAALAVAGVQASLAVGTQFFTVDPATLGLTGVQATLTASGSAPFTVTPATLVAAGVQPTIAGSGTGATFTVAAAVVTAAGVTVILSTPGALLYPKSVSGRKVLDQNGDVILIKTFSSWGMNQNLSDADITTALEGVKANGFNSVTATFGGPQVEGGDWHRYTNDAGQDFWTGTPWASSLGAAWGSVDWMLTEAARLGMFVNMSLFGGFGSTEGAGTDWEARTNANLNAAGVAVATRYLAVDNIVWHVELDTTHDPGSTRGQRVQAFFNGVNSVEGTTRRPVRWMECNNPSTTDSQGWLGVGDFNASINCGYRYIDTSVEQFETWWADVAGVPVGDCEPPYDGSGHYGGVAGQQLRERTYAIFVEGGCLENYGHEDWWPFGFSGLFSEGLTWQQVPAHSHTVHQKHAFDLFDLYLLDATWAPTSAFVTTGAGSGDTKAAVGIGATAAIAYFPTSRTIAVDTTQLPGSGAVRLRWFDPASGNFTTIAAAEAQTSGRSVTYPGNNSAGETDQVLVVDLAPGLSFTVTPATMTAAGVQASAAPSGSAPFTVASASMVAAGVAPSLNATGSATLTVTPATMGLSGVVAAEAGSGSAPLTVTPAALTLAGVAAVLAGSGTVALVVDPAALTIAGVQAPLAATGAQSFAVDPAALSLAGRDVGLAGAGAFTVTPAEMAASGVPIGLSGAGTASFAVSPALLALTGVAAPLGGTGAVSLAIAVAQLTMVGVPSSLSAPGAVSFAVTPAALGLAGVTIPLTASGTAAFTVGPATLTIVGEPAALSIAALQFVVAPASMGLAGVAAALDASGTAPFTVVPAQLTLEGVKLFGQLVIFTGPRLLTRADPPRTLVRADEPRTLRKER